MIQTNKAKTFLSKPYFSKKHSKTDENIMLSENSELNHEKSGYTWF